MKVTQSDAIHVFTLFAKRMGKTIGYKPDEWSLDHAPHYGGYVIEEHELNGAARQLFGGRLPCGEFCKAVEFALDVLDYQKETRHPLSIID